jgi:phage shock protein C
MNRRLTRSRNSMVAGVAAGVAEWINADPALVRIVWAVLVPLTSGAALLAYVVAWAVLPEAPRSPAATDPDPAVGGPPPSAETGPVTEGRTALLIGSGLVLIGLWFLVREFLPRIDWGLVWPFVLIGVGVFILVGTARRR